MESLKNIFYTNGIHGTTTWKEVENALYPILIRFAKHHVKKRDKVFLAMHKV